jgi:hypothetical protein
MYLRRRNDSVPSTTLSAQDNLKIDALLKQSKEEA